MKKVLIIGSLVVVAVFIFGAVGVASAQAILPRIFGSRMMSLPSDYAGDYSNTMYERMAAGGMMGGRGGQQGGFQTGSCGGSGVQGSGLLHDTMLAGFAEAFGISTDDLQARLDAGETMYDVALSFEYTQEQFTELMTTVRTDALTQAVADGVITQAQADWMLSRMAQRQGNGYGCATGTATGAGCPMGGGGRRP